MFGVMELKGSIEKRGERSWRLRIDLGYHAEGTRNRPSKPITIDDLALLKTKKKLKDYLDEQLVLFKKEIETGNYIQPGQYTFRDFVKQKYVTMYLSGLSENTQVEYLQIIETYFIPYFGAMNMESIKTLHCLDYMKSLKDKNYSNNFQRYHYTVLASIFRQAIEWKVIKTSPLKGVKKPPPGNSSELYYDADQVSMVLDLLITEPIRWRIYFTLSIIGGFRSGELSALCWRDINFDESTIRISKALKKGQAIGVPKSKTSKRVVNMPVWVMDELREYEVVWDGLKEAHLDRWIDKDNDYLFCRDNGIPLYKNTPTQRWIKFTRKHKIPHIRLHDLRHTAATLLIEDNVNLKVIQERHGHADYRTTVNIYSHVTKRLSDEAVGKLEKFGRPQFVPNDDNSDHEQVTNP
ncbi:site-specific integrase [Paenibacillus sp. 79R4]|nr:site-specific integrase [Paenibacillus sp. 79R4]